MYFSPPGKEEAVLTVRMDKLVHLLHEPIEMVIVRQEVEANRRLLQVQQFHLMAMVPEPFHVGQLPVLEDIQARHDHEALRKLEPLEAPAPWAEGVARRVVSIFPFREESSPVPIAVGNPDKVPTVQSHLRFRSLLPAKQSMEEDITQNLDSLIGRLHSYVVHDIAARAISGQVHIDL